MSVSREPLLEKVILRNTENSGWLVFEKPLEVLTARDSTQVLPVLLEAEKKAAEANLFVAGFVRYEAASGFDSAHKTHAPGGVPLVCLGLFDEPQSSHHLEAPTSASQPVSGWTMSESPADYADKISAIKRQIQRGNTYQINYTLRQSAEIADPWQLFLGIATDVAHAAYVEYLGQAIVCASPELFFQLQGEQLICRPMKGTAPRGMTTAADLAMGEELHDSVKNRAENVMITDMVRNDLGRIAKVGSVHASALFAVEKLKTVWQMTSTVTASTTASITEIFEALFPCASVTGAPKVASMAVIADLEATPRGIYTGAIGFFGPGRQAKFNVAIRTVAVDKKTNEAVYGIGGGIVWDSEADEEYAECLSKARILSAPHVQPKDFQLLETMLWSPEEGFFLIDEHLSRLRSSAAYFDFEFNLGKIRSVLSRRAKKLPKLAHRIRLLLYRDGRVRTSHVLYVASSDQPVRVALAADPIDKKDPFLYHKTTRRGVYARALQSVGADDVLLWNREGYITETSIANVIIDIDGELYTPPVESGLLGGTYRTYMLKGGRIKERPIKVSEVTPATEMTLINSVRGAYAAVFEGIGQCVDPTS